jgi:hypothetical protein
MRVIALGGAGAMAKLAVRDLAGKDGIEELVIADYNLGAADACRRVGEKVFGKEDRREQPC